MANGNQKEKPKRLEYQAKDVRGPLRSVQETEDRRKEREGGGRSS